jgi:signal transduction histidine kinase
MISWSMNASSRGNPHICDPESDSWPNARSTGDSTNGRAVHADEHPETLADALQQRDQARRIARRDRTTREGLIEALRGLSDRSVALETQNRELAAEIKQLRGERERRSAVPRKSHPVQASLPIQARTFLAGEDERRRLERDLHDGVQNELVALIVKLTLAEEDHNTPPALAGTLPDLVARAEAALHSVREIAHGIYPSPLAAFGVLEALRAQAMRASLDIRVEGSTPRSTEQAEVAVYFSCLEAIQNVAKHAGREARVTLRCRHQHGTLVVRIEDDGSGFDPAHTPDGAGLSNIHDRVRALNGKVKLASTAGHGTVMTIALPLAPREAKTAPDRPANQAVDEPSRDETRAPQIREVVR